MHSADHGSIFDSLEPRLLLSTPTPPISFQMSRGTLRVTGTKGSDSIILSVRKGKLLNNGRLAFRLGKDFKQIFIDSKGGDDLIRFQFDSPDLRTKIHGGTGNDTIFGTS